MGKPGLSFGKTESWHQGWRGKVSMTEIRRDGIIVGHITGREIGLGSSMVYEIVLDDERENVTYYTLAEARAAILRRNDNGGA